MVQRLMRSFVVFSMVVAFLCPAAAVRAGTTGSISGTVTNPTTKAPVAQARVTVASASQTVSTTTDAGGHFTFASLAPDTYTVSVQKSGFESTAQSGVNVFADAEQVVNLSEATTLRTIGQVTARANTSLVKPGTTADVYSVSAVQQDKFSGVGGGGGLNNAYSAIATVPGAYVPSNQAGYFQTIHIRGGDYDQVGYEIDGVPVNRSFDNYPAGTASSLGQQELQVYTGAAPPNAEGQGLAGFINQVIKSGTYPGFATGILSIGGPAYYHKASIEFGGASQNRNFSYYVGLGGYDQDFRYVDQGNGQGLRPYGSIVGIPKSTPTTLDGTPFGPIVTTAFEVGDPSQVSDRDTVINLHLGIPHKNGIKDDVQLLFLNNFLRTYFFSSPNDTGLNSFSDAGASVPTYADAYQYTGQLGGFLPSNAAQLVKPSLFPSSLTSRTFGSNLPVDVRDSYQNNQSIIKLQYQKNFSSNAYFRLYGYTDYSNWLQNGPNFANNVYFNNGFPLDAVSGDYELSAHGRGLSGTIADQINPQHLLQLQGSYTTATTLRDNNTGFVNSEGARGNFAELVDSNDPLSGICYNVANAVGTAAQATNCNTYKGTPAATSLTLKNVYNSGQPGGAPVNLNYSNFTCGTGPCRFFAVENGQFATYNTVKPNFVAGSLTDTYKPTDRVVVNLGLRYDLYQFQGSNTTGSPARTLFFNSFNRTNCVDPSGNVVTKTSLNIGVTAGCATADSATAAYTTPNLQNIPSQVNTYPVFEPRLGATFTVDPNTVLRASYGRYSQAPNTAYEQYDTLQQNSPYSLLGTAFYKFGFTTPAHQVTPEVSNNYDVSVEHRFNNSDVSLKVTPFLRYTQNQIQNFFLDQASGFVSGLNADRLTSRGVELQINKGDFVRDGFSGQLAFTYTNAFAKYNTFSNGTTVFTGINNDIQKYNGYTSYCSTHATDSRCPAGGSPNAAPCFSLVTAAGGGTPAACGANTVANPYFNAPVQSLVDTNGNYVPFTLIAGGIGSAAESYLTPYVATMVLQYKKGKFAATPSFQFSAGQRYGVPEAVAGIDPTTCTAGLTGSTAADPRYPYGAAGGLPFDASACSSLGSAIPDPFTKRFDGIGDFVSPSNFVTNLQLSYDATKNFTLVATFANIINNCFGGSQQAWTTGGSQVCSYGLVDAGNAYQPVGNTYNPGANIAPALQFPYERSYGVFNTNSTSIKYPFSVFVDARFKV